MVIAVDFDGTLCEDAFPEIGAPNIYLIEALKSHQKNGDKLILWTCRCGEYLDNAVEWCKEQGLIFDAINKNVPDVVAKYGEGGPKVFADLYIDDRIQGPDNCSTALMRLNQLAAFHGFPIDIRFDDHHIFASINGHKITFYPQDLFEYFYDTNLIYKEIERIANEEGIKEND